MAIPVRKRISSASISARGITGMPFWRAATTSGLSSGNRAGLYQHVDVIHIPGGVPDMDIRPERAQTLNHRLSAMSEPCTS